MTSLATAEAKSHFSEMIDRASKGEEIIITKRGRPVVKVIPFEKKTQSQINAFLDQMQEFRDNQKSKEPVLKEGESWRDLAHEGHQW